ncbi:MAG: YqaJ viral recombinase family protein, partial [Pseudomonadales bacterium]|nr:YqaJ viral recombinase family protein [Pseudomonadales bacterium]
MNLLNVLQGSEQWHEVRGKCFTASEAPAMMGASKYMTRDQLLHQKATGERPEISPGQQALFDRGHAAEASIRPVIEEIVGEELYPVTGTDGGKLLASFDGID